MAKKKPSNSGSKQSSRKLTDILGRVTVGTLFLFGISIYVFMMVLGTQAGEEECLGTSGKEPILCYECIATSEDHFCSDPFNETHPGVEVRRCKEYCAKWTRTTLTGKKYYQRSCSDQLHVTLRKSTVCIHESRPSSGQLCFCDQNHCNGASALHATYFSVILALILVVVNFHRNGIVNDVVEIWR